MNFSSYKPSTEENLTKWSQQCPVLAQTLGADATALTRRNINGEENSLMLSQHNHINDQSVRTLNSQQELQPEPAANVLKDCLDMANNKLKELMESHEATKKDDAPQQMIPGKLSNKFYIKLEAEIPQPVIEDSDAEYTDAGFYSRETDICKDSSDTESASSFTTEGIATMEILEYEVASTSGDNSNYLYSHDSSSGTDDFYLAAVAASAMCSALSSSCTSTSDFADTEDTDSDTESHDPELSSADYWVCIKCKNKQNNPFFRYCEKCYQIRKTHFPPRPIQRKPRRKRPSIGDFTPRHRKSLAAAECTSSPSATPTSRVQLNDTPTACKLNMKRKSSRQSRSKKNFKKRRLMLNSNQLNSAAETSSEGISSDPEHEGSSRINNFQSTETQVGYRFSNQKRSATAAGLNEEAQDPTKRQKHLLTNLEDPAFQKNRLNYLSKHSGISSSISSQEPAITSEVGFPRKIVENENLETCAQQTASDKLDDKNSEALQKPEDIVDTENTAALPVSAVKNHISDLNPALMKNDDFNLPVRSHSACSSRGTLENRCTQLDATHSNYSQPFSTNLEASNENCIICLSEPKNGVFVHSRFLHLCCCYKCAVKIWNKRKRCPICNCAVNNVMKLFVH